MIGTKEDSFKRYVGQKTGFSNHLLIGKSQCQKSCCFRGSKFKRKKDFREDRSLNNIIFNPNAMHNIYLYIINNNRRKKRLSSWEWGGMGGV